MSNPLTKLEAAIQCQKFDTKMTQMQCEEVTIDRDKLMVENGAVVKNNFNN